MTIRFKRRPAVPPELATLLCVWMVALATGTSISACAGRGESPGVIVFHKDAAQEAYAHMPQSACQLICGPWDRAPAA